MKIKIILLLAFALGVLNCLGQNNVIDQLLNRPVTVIVIDGDTFLQRDLTDYLNLTLGKDEHSSNNIESDAHTNVSVLRDYFMRFHPSVFTIQKYFNQASKEFDVPVSLLMVVGQVENNWTQTGPRIDQGWGIMHLVQNGYCNTLSEAAQLIGVSEQVLKDDAQQNIRGAAALLAKYAGKKKEKFKKLTDWFSAVAQFSGLISPELRDMQAINYFETLKNGVKSKTVWGEEIIIDAKKNLQLKNINLKNSNENILPKLLSADYAPALTNWAATCNYGTGRGGYSIDTWVNHWTDGTYLGTISHFQSCPCPNSCTPCYTGLCPSSGYRNCCVGASSAHFVIKNSNGEITQMVAVANTAWHSGASGNPANNPRSIGVEHEVLSANPSQWNSIPMLQASATMACYFKNQYGFPTTQNASPGICGHNDMPGTSTACPGPLPWSTWYSYFNSACGGTSLLCGNDYSCGPPAPLFLNINASCINTSCSTVGATSTSIGFNGASNCSTPYQSGRYDDDVWFTITPSNLNPITINVTPTSNLSNFDPVVGVYSGNCSSPIQVACADVNGNGGSEQIVFTPTSLTSHLIRVFGYGIGSAYSGNFNICAFGSSTVCPDNFETNNNCAASTLVFASPLGNGTSNYTLNANIGYAGDQDWYQVNTTACGQLSITLSNLPYNYDLEVYGSGCLGQFIAGSYQSGTNTEQIVQLVNSSSLTTYYIKVYPNISSTYTTASCYNLNFQWASTGGPSQPGNISGNTTVCQSSSQTYSISSVSGATSYTWSLPSGWSGSSSSTSINTIAGSAGGTISVTANNSCGNSSPRSLSVTVNQTPSQPGNISGNTSVCQSSQQTYSISAVSGATSYTWSLPSGWSGNSSSTSITATTGGSGGTISVTANNNCGSSTLRTLSVTVNQTPSQPGSISGNTVVCQSSSQTYSINAVSGATSYTWTLPSGWSGSSTSTSITATVGNSGGSISVTANNICGSSSPRTLLVSINNTPPSASITASGTTNFCPGGYVTLTANAGGGFTYQWQNNGNSISGETGISLFDTISGNFNVIVTNTAGCTAISNTITVNKWGETNVCPEPVMGFSTINITSTTAKVKWKPRICAEGYYVSYRKDGVSPWVSKAVNTNTGFKNLFGLSPSTTYQWKVRSRCDIANNINSAYSAIQTFTTPAMRFDEDLEEMVNDVKIFPNPTSGKFIFEFNSEENENSCFIEIYNSLGQFVFQTVIEIKEGINQKEFDLSKFPSGIYFLNLKTENDVFRKKIIKE